ncbi:hypothetical protein [Mycobacterium sp. AZCC_0083]|uniref:hypothetical protein n=1 Tax=Mycobacterium sp. AZCC_0083 TaxID=2735882 RepID=UPI0016209788|nr:hypothetical protein [Mycobacterium sp. AZCC_0083]MBB5167173.1 hypothetical protein [Mycobacterium sp. AZCC_0083]
MTLQTFTHNPTKVGAIQVARPWSGVERSVPTARQVKTGAGGLAWFVVSTHGSLETQRAYAGDWIVRHPNGSHEVLTDDQFQLYYGDSKDVDTDPAED